MRGSYGAGSCDCDGQPETQESEPTAFGKAIERDKDWRYVSAEELETLFDACPNAGWRVLPGLCRLAGLRVGEALDLQWGRVDWTANRISVIAQKTGKRRLVPLEPRLQTLLIEAYEAATAGDTYVVSVGDVSRSSFRRRFDSIVRRAGLEPWSAPYQVLRRNCETDWAQAYPQYVVSAWMGHDISVSARHYLQVPEELYRRMAEEGTMPAIRASRNPQSPAHLQNNCKTAVWPPDRDSMQPLVTTEYPRQDSNLRPVAPEESDAGATDVAGAYKVERIGATGVLDFQHGSGWRIKGDSIVNPQVIGLSMFAFEIQLVDETAAVFGAEPKRIDTL